MSGPAIARDRAAWTRAADQAAEAAASADRAACLLRRAADAPPAIESERAGRAAARALTVAVAAVQCAARGLEDLA